jgi:hypothetical protein
MLEKTVEGSFQQRAEVIERFWHTVICGQMCALAHTKYTQLNSNVF